MFAQPALPPCTTPVVQVWEYERTTCDVKPPQRLDVRLHPTRFEVTVRAIDECNDAGGELIARRLHRGWLSLTCEGVDY